MIQYSEKVILFKLYLQNILHTQTLNFICFTNNNIKPLTHKFSSHSLLHLRKETNHIHNN